jgi:hypothetical protein
MPLNGVINISFTAKSSPGVGVKKHDFKEVLLISRA